MKIPYYSPNLSFIDFLKAIISSTNYSKSELIDYFLKLTGKKYILFTNSCRTALFLTYKALDFEGVVITSPLACKVAIDPILESGKFVEYADINIKDLNINSDDITKRITNKTKAIQVIHLGGVPCDMSSIKEIAKENNLFLIEDCAQSLGAIYKGKYTGSFGDVSCFSLIKNAYGIGGGVIVTDSETLHKKILAEIDKLAKPSLLIDIFRVFRNILTTNFGNYVSRLILSVLIIIKNESRSYSSIINQLKSASNLQIKIAARQLKKISRLHSRRKAIGISLFEKLNREKLILNNGIDPQKCSFTKFFLYSTKINSREALCYFNKKGVTVMHLEQKSGSPFQNRIVNRHSSVLKGLINYNLVHDNIISLPIVEWFSERDIDKIVKVVKTFEEK